MMLPYSEVRAFVQHLAPTWHKPQHENFAQLLCALLARGRLNLCDLARALDPPSQSVHGRLKRLTRFLDTPHLDEAALSVRWLKLA